MTRTIQRAAVLGSGVMGSQIAAHLANAGVPTALLDIAPKELLPAEEARGLTLDSPEVRNRIALAGLEKAKKMKPAAFVASEACGLIRVGNFEDHLAWLSEVDWIIEAVVENLEIKRQLLTRVDRLRSDGAIVSSNTSGIPISSIGWDLSPDFRRHFLGTHFFNPPRYLRLLEVIPTPETLNEVSVFLADFCDRTLGKNIVYAKDTPNFIANRIGTFSALHTMRVMQEGEFSIEEVDAITGPVIGHAKSATFRTLDIAGIDTAVNVARNLYPAVPQDERRDLFVVPGLLDEMVKRGWLGDKSGQGFYKKIKTAEGKEILALDYRTMEYRPRRKIRFPSIDMARNVDDLGERIRMLVYGKDRVADFLWKTTSEALAYTANRIPEIAGDIVQVDRAIRWGFNRQLGPFELWDAIGVAESVKRMESEGKAIPELVQRLLASDKSGFYAMREGRRRYYDLQTSDYQTLSNPPGVTILSDLKTQGKVIRENPGATLIDLGDGVACLEFHSKMNAIGADTVQMMNFAAKALTEEFDGLVIGNQAENFCVGANIMMLLLAAQEGEWDEIDLSVRAFQRANLSLRYSPKPVVVAPFGMTLGGGCEIVLHGDRVCAAAETYIGLVEAGVGLIPAGGGVTEMLARALEPIPDRDRADALPYLKTTFETIGMAKVATSAAEARKLGFLRNVDGISMNRDRLIEDAKQQVLSLMRSSYRPPQSGRHLTAYGESVLATLKLGVYLMKEAGYISEYDQHIGNKLAWVLCGGDLRTRREMPEQYFLDLERQAFLSLCGERKTQERLQHMLQTGKPLRN